MIGSLHSAEIQYLEIGFYCENVYPGRYEPVSETIITRHWINSSQFQPMQEKLPLIRLGWCHQCQEIPSHTPTRDIR